MIPKAIIAILLFLTVVFLAAVSAAAVYVQRHYLRHLLAVDSILRQLPPEEASPPGVITGPISKLHTNGFEFFVTRSLVSEFYQQPPRMLDWHLRNFVWLQLLPRRLNRTELLGLYVHFMQFEGGRGLVYGAHHYYGKAPHQLTEREALELFVISQDPHGYSPTENPERFRAAVERFAERLGAPAA